MVGAWMAARQWQRWRQWFQPVAVLALLAAGSPGYAAESDATGGDLWNPEILTPVNQDTPATVRNAVKMVESMPAAKALEDHLQTAADTFGVDFYLLQALIATESGFNGRVVSRSGAVGLMQLMPSTARAMGLVAGKGTSLRQKLQDPKVNIHYGAKYFATIQNMFAGRLDLALAAYNSGHGSVLRAGNQVPPIAETQNFVKKVTGIYYTLKLRALAQVQPGNPVTEPATYTAENLPPLSVQ